MLIDDSCRHQLLLIDFMTGFLMKLCSHINNLDAQYIRTLVETASFHQMEALQDAIWKHLALKTSLRVKLPVCIPNNREEL